MSSNTLTGNLNGQKMNYLILKELNSFSIREHPNKLLSKVRDTYSSKCLLSH